MQFYQNLCCIFDLFQVNKILIVNMFCEDQPVLNLEPVPEASVSTVEERTLEEREKWGSLGLKAIHEGKLAIVLLSRGQVLFIMKYFLGKEQRRNKIKLKFILCMRDRLI